MSCIVITKEIKELASNFPNETEQSIANLVGKWQETIGKVEEYPSVRVLSDFIKEIRSEKKKEISAKLNIAELLNKLNLVYDPQVKRDRVSLIARLFSNEVTRISEQTQEQDRFKIISEQTPKGILDTIKNIFSSYINSPLETIIQEEYKNINSKKGSEKYSEEQKVQAARKKAEYKIQEYNKILDNFPALIEEASRILLTTERIKLNVIGIAPTKANLSEDTPEGDSETEEQSDDFKQEEAYKDGWMINCRQTSSMERLSQITRNTISKLPSLNYEGKYERDDLGYLRYLDGNFVHATLIDKLRFMTSSDEMIPLLEDLAKTKIWVKQIIKKLTPQQGDSETTIANKETLFSQFYQDFRSDFLSYWIQKAKTLSDGSISYETISINTPEGIYYLLDSWRSNYESGHILTKDSVYDEKGDINKENAKKGLQIIENLNNNFNNLSTKEKIALFETSETWNEIIKALNMVGVNVNPAILKNALTNIKTSSKVTYTDPVILLLSDLNVIFKGIIDNKIKDVTTEDGTVHKGDLINTFNSAYNDIAIMLAEVTEDAIESSVRENNKSYYSHSNPSYLGKIIKRLKNVLGDSEKFNSFINQEYKQYEWFFKDGEWLNDWLQQLESSDSMRKGLDHKVLLNFDKKEYSDWDNLDYTLILLNEYWGDPDSKNKDVQWAWYHVPILSDSPSAEFIKFRKYTSGKIVNSNGKYLSYKDILIEKFRNLIIQEYNRIMLVRARDAKFQEGNNDIVPIANFDISRDINGNIKSIGGAEFKFLPKLNTLFYNGKSFIDLLEELLESGSGPSINEFLSKTITDVLDEGFAEEYTKWRNIGLFTELDNGKYKYLPFKGQSEQNQRLLNILNEVKKIFGNRWSSPMEELIQKLKSNSYISIKEVNDILNNIKNIASQEHVILSDKIHSGLYYRNNALTALEEYYWNSKFASSQIIQLTTTDLAYYKDLEDFQKRYKEVHTPSLRLNTKAKFNGELVGRELERTILIKDEEITSEILNDIAEVLDAKVSKGEMTTVDRDYIISKYNKVNVTDAQAYRSLSSYRAIMVMSGQWTDAMEKAYNNLKNNTWNIEDFSIIWQTKKPFVYTQVNKNSGIENHSNMKVPIQHKNSEFLLLAMYEVISSPLNKSSKLTAINEFMEANGIDVVQFDSTTKVGKQGVIDLKNLTSKNDILRKLKESTGIGTSTAENPNVVHTIPYEDYGIVTATPEHVIDAVQLIGTQIRKLIASDIPDNINIEIDGISKSKKEWIDLYNEINTENILQQFAEVDKIFKDPKKVEQVLIEEIKGNQRYSIDLLQACTLDDNGNFNIPLYDPVQSQKVQQLLNSIIKSRITKQKIRGGALILASDFGLTNDLQIVFEGSGENKRIKYIECYMPAYTREFYEPLMKEGTHELDITKLPDDLRKLIGYRVPTESKYSMAPLYIKGFLPQQNGSAIMLPAEITTIAGSDFDVKLY